MFLARNYLYHTRFAGCVLSRSYDLFMENHLWISSRIGKYRRIKINIIVTATNLIPSIFIDECNNHTYFCGLWPEDIVLWLEEPPVLNPEDKLSLLTHSTWLEFKMLLLKASSSSTTELASLSNKPLQSLARPSEEKSLSATAAYGSGEKHQVLKSVILSQQHPQFIPW